MLFVFVDFDFVKATDYFKPLKGVITFICVHRFRVQCFFVCFC